MIKSAGPGRGVSAAPVLLDGPRTAAASEGVLLWVASARPSTVRPAELVQVQADCSETRLEQLRVLLLCGRDGLCLVGWWW